MHRPDLDDIVRLRSSKPYKRRWYELYQAGDKLPRTLGETWMIVEAPTYPPASAYERLIESPMAFDIRSVSVNDILAWPPAKAVVLREIPGLEARLKTPQLVPHLSNFSIQDLVNFGALQSDRLSEIDAQLRALPPLAGTAS